jgi:hypothetical protein
MWCNIKYYPLRNGRTAQHPSTLTFPRAQRDYIAAQMSDYHRSRICGINILLALLVENKLILGKTACHRQNAAALFLLFV